MAAPREGEELLPGGLTNAGRVVRVGDTVRRPLRSTSSAGHAVLGHLEQVGFAGAPRLLGRDEHDREVLEFIEGSAVYEPYPAWSLEDDALASVAELLRSFHEAVASFDPAGRAWPEAVPRAFRGATISHNDPNLDNVIFRDGRAVALIDFDLASPGSPEWDVACAARLWAPLRDERDVPGRLRGRGLARLRLFCDAYGATAAQRRRVAEALPAAHAWAYAIVRRAIAGGHETFSRAWASGDRVRAERTAAWLSSHDPEVRRALGVARGDLE